MGIVEAGDYGSTFAIAKFSSGSHKETKVILIADRQNPIAFDSYQFSRGLFRIQGYYPSVIKDKVRGSSEIRFIH